ncbi:hypothetical protein EVAR_42563_1 [Eumeta japonica]|uniref:Uncharacterized protein n=1 Tax=Eumeta variegata TaxID=151549 RepID=A0A4C1WS97_EUMVA|nr:hypothetical protein EVAR_42563_1 [Eumeta japonica]
MKRAARAKLRPILTSRLPIRTKIAIYNCYIHSRLTYAAPAWYALYSEQQRQRLEVQANASDDRGGGLGLMMESEGKHRNSIMKQRILAVFGLVEIVLRCTLTMNDFQGLMMQLEGKH